MTKKERAAIKKLVTRLCANYDREYQECMPLDGGCYMLNKWYTGSFCKYFRDAVLPTEPLLEAALTGEDISNRKQCPICGNGFLPVTSQAYCSDKCREAGRKDSYRKSKRKQRQNQ